MSDQIDRFRKMLGEMTPGKVTPCLGSGGNLCTALCVDPREPGERPVMIADFLPDYFLEEEGVNCPPRHQEDMNGYAAIRNVIEALLDEVRILRMIHDDECVWKKRGIECDGQTATVATDAAIESALPEVE